MKNKNSKDSDLAALHKRLGASMEERNSSRGFFGNFIADGLAFSLTKEIALDTLRDDLTIREWFLIAKNSLVESSLYEVSLRKIEVAIVRMSDPIINDEKSFRGIKNTLDVDRAELSGDELLDLYKMIKDLGRIKRCDDNGWKCREEFWLESPTSLVVCIIANTLHLQNFIEKMGKDILKDALYFRNFAVRKSIDIYGWGP